MIKAIEGLITKKDPTSIWILPVCSVHAQALPARMELQFLKK